MKYTSRFAASLMAFGLMMPGVQAFNDVPSDTWFAPYVQELESMQIIDSGDQYYPARNLNRAEMVKMVITAVDALDGYTPHEVSAFDDVKTTDWFYPYVDAAATFAIVNGYADQQGNFTGYFGPGDDLRRSEAVKIIIEAFDLGVDTWTDTEFSDVTAGQWFYTYVKDAEALGIVDGYENGSFGPERPVTRAEIAKMMSIAIERRLEQHGSLKIGDLTQDTAPDPDGPVMVPTDPEANPDEVPAEEEEPAQEEMLKAVPNPLNLENAVISGSNETLVARYDFEGQLEGFMVDRVTVVNDATGDDLGDDNTGTPTVKEIVVKYPNKEGNLQTQNGVLKADGTALFSNLDFYVPKDESAFFEIYAVMTPFADLNESYSGEVIRLGLPNVNNTTDTFKAVGEFSDKVVTFGEGALLTQSSKPKEFTVRKTRLSFAVAQESGDLSEGANSLMEFDVTADEAGSAALGRMVFDVTVSDSDGANLSLDSFKLYKGNTLLDNVVIYDATGTQDLSPNQGSLSNGLHKVIVSFDQEQIIPAGQTTTFRLRADANGTSDGDDVITRISDGDLEALSGLTAANQVNTGKLYVDGDATAGLFTNATDFSQTVGTYLNIVWSDRSADSHQYPQISNGTVTTDTGTYDWTNGHLLGLASLPATVLTQ